MWYRAQAYDLLEEAGISFAQPEVDEARFEVDGKLTRISWREVDRAWFLLLYDGRNPPVILHDIDLPSPLGETNATVTP